MKHLIPLSDNPSRFLEITHAFIQEVENKFMKAPNIISGLIKDGNTNANNQSNFSFN
jgi:hypothetical protein